MDSSKILNIAIAVLLVCVVLASLAITASTMNVQRLPPQQTGVKTAPIAQPQKQGIANAPQLTIKPTIGPTVIPTIIPTPTPVPTYQHVPFPTVQVGPAEPPIGPTVRHVPFPPVQVGPNEPSIGGYRPQPYPP